MKDIYVCEDETRFIIKQGGLYYPFIYKDDKDEILDIINQLSNDLRFYSRYTDKEVERKISKLDFISLEEWLILN